MRSPNESVCAFVVEHPPEIADEVSSGLWDAGTLGIEERTPERERGVLVAYFPVDADLSAFHEWARVNDVSVARTSVPDVDWVARFRETFCSFEHAGFRIVPVWEKPSPGPGELLVDPGRAFGTGTHETTRLCLDAIRRLSAKHPLGSVLDLGSGTGLLALAALRCGAARALATDFDPEATASAQLHARLNGLRLDVVLADGGRPLRPGSFDLILANIAAPLLIERANEIIPLLRSSGDLVLSGLLLSDVDEVARAYERCGPPEVYTSGEWAALVLPAAHP